MLIGGVIQHEIHDDADSPLVSLLHQRVEVVERAEPWVNVDVITDIVAEISHRRRIDGREPDGVDAERCCGVAAEVLKP